MPITIAGIEIISDSKREETSIKTPPTINSKPPSCSCFQAIMVKIMRMKLGIKCISKAKNHCGSPKTSRVKMLIKAINEVANKRFFSY